jgi:hypothetical protein
MIPHTMTPEEKDRIEAFHRELSQDIRVTLFTGGDSRDRRFAKFCEDLNRIAPRISLLREKSDEKEKPELRLGSRIRYRAVPLGHELGPFLMALSMLAESGKNPLPQALREKLSGLSVPATLKMYVAEGCRFCPAALERILPMVLENPMIRLLVIDGGLFPEDARADAVKSVPTLLLDDRFRWTGRIQPDEVVDALLRRDVLHMGVASLEGMLSEGQAGRVAEMIIRRGEIFPALLEVLVHPKWPVRLGAMVVLESLAEEAPALAARASAPLLERFDRADDPVKGDILYLVGLLGSSESLSRLRKILDREASPEVREAASEAIQSIARKSDP